MGILFVHGAGGWAEDQPMADQLRTLSGQAVTMSRFPDEDMSAAAWRHERGGHQFQGRMAAVAEDLASLVQ
ncbi:hypothetical protein KKR91_06355 [Arthrobacter jiangjiafuii]|uniref:Alpha/beta hydrolase n=1 Tax=Arthrobacter jiangjiafuii TaxID=2817475 RepID=A0A975M737_9MICC|nr:hypothetical protein [Arthrobacter jiangjiafuii]MBP3044224.1 hypothetical protein [Arthrobacter jiangjiafuii]QWC11188.1 hypothetical protein KKR91_06355 [Arthrobacter jiangjiafuii]